MLALRCRFVQSGYQPSSIWVVFFFQAEDGIRDLVRSRGLGDVYKRQLEHWPEFLENTPTILTPGVGEQLRRPLADRRILAVSYTHLTLPTSDLV